jgi:hypothetical protein
VKLRQPRLGTFPYSPLAISESARDLALANALVAAMSFMRAPT